MPPPASGFWYWAVVKSFRLNRVSPHFIHAVLATEDHRFWAHHGIDKLRTLKALWITLFESGKIQGASTITQQAREKSFFYLQAQLYAKISGTDGCPSDRSAVQQTGNTGSVCQSDPFWGGGVWDRKSRTNLFWKIGHGSRPGRVGIAGRTAQIPTRYNPYRHYTRAKSRQRIVLSRMAATGYITPAHAHQTSLDRLELKSGTSGARTGSYFIDMVIQRLETRYGPYAVYHGGLKVTTPFIRKSSHGPWRPCRTDSVPSIK